MRIVSVVTFVVLGCSINAYAGGKKDIPNKIKTGRELEKTHQEKMREVMAELKNTSEEAQDAVIARALNAELETLSRILPGWCRHVPPSILIYVGFDENDPDLIRSLKFIRLGLFIRDMYEDYPINHDTFLTYDAPGPERLDMRTRIRLAANAFMQSYNLLQYHEAELDIDLKLSMADLGNWALHQMDSLGSEDAAQTVELAINMNHFANRGLLNLKLNAEQRGHLDRLVQSTILIFSKHVAPVVVAALLNYKMHHTN